MSIQVLSGSPVAFDSMLFCKVDWNFARSLGTILVLLIVLVVL